MPHQARTRSGLSRWLTAGAAAAMALGLGACGSSSSGDPTGSQGNDQAQQVANVPGVPHAIPTMDQLYAGTESPPPSSGPAAVPGKSVVFVSCGQLSEGCAGPGDGVAEAAKKLGWRYSVTDAKFNVAGGFAAAVRQAITQKPSAIVLYGYDCSYGKQALQEAKAQGIVLVGLTIDDCGTGQDALLSVSPTYTREETTNQSYWGRLGAMEAAYVINKTGGKAKSLLLEQTDSSAPTAAASKAMFAQCAGCKVVDRISATAAEYDPTSHMVDNFDLALTRHPEVNSLVLNYDTALYVAGLAQELKSKQSGRNLTVTASGGTTAGMGLLAQDGSPYTGAIAYDTHWLGWAAMDALNRHFAHAEQVPEGAGFRLVTKDHGAPGGGARYVSPIDYQSAYEKVWGSAGN